MAVTNLALRPAETRLAALFTIDPLTGCWNWNGALSSQGDYPGFSDGGRFVYAYRLSYSLANGPIEAGFAVHHTCGNRTCINPGHLAAMSRQEHRALHAQEYRAIRVIKGRVYQRLRECGMAACEIASMIGNSANTVRRLIRAARAAQSVGDLQAVTV
jgi:hypothetical protein